jgi:hypothetical protein
MGKLFDSMKHRGAALPQAASVATTPRLQVLPAETELMPVNDHVVMPFYEVPNEQEATSSQGQKTAQHAAPEEVFAKTEPIIALPPTLTVASPPKVEPVSRLSFSSAETRHHHDLRHIADEVVVIHQPHSHEAHDYRQMAEQLLHELHSLQASSLTLLPVQTGAASTLVANLGTAWADLTRLPVVLIDAARSKPGDDLACYFGLTPAPGWEELMTGSMLGETIQQTGRAWLDLIGSGRRLAWSNTQAWATKAQQVMHELQKHYRHILLMGPAFPHSPLGLVLAETTATTCLLVQAEHKHAEHVDTVSHTLTQLGKPLVGSIVL